MGPTRFRPSSDIIAVGGGGTVAEVLEFGGSEVIRDGRRGTRRAEYAARPYMAPALVEATGNPKLMDAWRDVIVD